MTILIILVLLFIIFTVPHGTIVFKTSTVYGFLTAVAAIAIIAILYNCVIYVKEEIIPSAIRGTTKGLGNLYSLSIDLSTNRYFSAILISLICLVLCINILKSKSGVNAKIEIDSSNRRLKEILKDF